VTRFHYIQPQLLLGRLFLARQCIAWRPHLHHVDAGPDGGRAIRAIRTCLSHFIRVTNQTRSATLAETAEVADTSAKRRAGLLKRRELRQGEGLWIAPCEAVHTAGMKFAIDVLFLDRKRRIRKVRERMGPWRAAMSLLSHSVLELPAGTVEATGTRKGDQLTFHGV